MLETVRDDVENDRYDVEETVRRLRQLEEKGLILPSIIYPVLRLDGNVGEQVSSH